MAYGQPRCPLSLRSGAVAALALVLDLSVPAPSRAACDTTTTSTSTRSTTTTTNITCSPVGSACGSCGDGFCFSPYPNPPSGVCLDVSASMGGMACGIDPPIPCPPGQLCVV